MSPLLIGLAFAAFQNSAIVPVPINADWWMNRHKAMVEVAQRGEAKIVFVGDSITHAFGGEPDTGQSYQNRGKDTWDLYYGADNALNLGISGDRTQHVLWRLDHGEMGTCKPKVTVVMIGTNNLGGQATKIPSNTPEQISEGVEAVCEKVRALVPKTKILLLGVFPRAKANSAFRKSIVEINKQLAVWAPAHRITYLDIGYVFVDAKGEIPTTVMPDLLHPFAYGYRKWAMAMEPTLAKLMGRRPKTRLDPMNSAVVPIPQNPGSPNSWWATRFARTKQYAKDHICRLAILGASINQFFGGPPIEPGQKEVKPVWQKFYRTRDAVDLGFGGDRTENVLWRLEQGQLDNMPLQAISIMVGTNNLLVNTPEQIRDGLQAIVEKIREQKPKTKILLLAIFPTGQHRDDPIRLAAVEVDKLLAPIGRQRNVTFMDIGSKFLEPDGTISTSTMADFRHPTDKGYEIWAEAVEPWMKRNVTP